VEASQSHQSLPSAGAFPPLETKETLAFADPFPSDLQPPASSGNPFVSGSRVSQASGPGSNSASAQVTPVEFPLEFPVKPSLEGPAPAEPDPADLPDLPVLIPTSNQAETPNLEAF